MTIRYHSHKFIDFDFVGLRLNAERLNFGSLTRHTNRWRAIMEFAPAELKGLNSLC